MREVVGRRLEPLDPATREVLAIAGVAGRPFTIAGVARVGGLGRESVAVALEPALAGRLVEPRADAPGRFGFAHAIVRDAVYDELTPALRARLHSAFAAVLQESLEAGGEATAAEAAHHALAAARCGADPQPAWALSLEAAREAAALHAHAEAAAHFGGALEALELGADVSPAERLDATMALAAATFAAGDIDAARRRFAAVAGAARRSGAAELQARAALGFSQVQPYGVIDEEAIALLQGALDALPPDDSALRAKAAARLGQRLDPVTDQSRREALVDEGIAMARRLGDDDALLGLLTAAALVNWPPARAADRAAATGEVLGLAARGSDLAGVFWARTLRLRDALEAGELDSGRRRARAARAALGREPARVLPLVPARPPVRARDVRRPRSRRASGSPTRPRSSTAATAATSRSTPRRGSRSPSSAGAPPTRRSKRCAGSPAGTPRSRSGRRCSPRSSGASAARAGAARWRAARATASPPSCAARTGSAGSSCSPSRWWRGARRSRRRR